MGSDLLGGAVPDGIMLEGAQDRSAVSAGLRGRYLRFNDTRPSRFVYQLGRGGGYCAEMIGLLKVMQACVAEDLRLCLGQNVRARGYAVENGWDEYFEPFMPVVPGRFLGVLNDRWRGFDRVPSFRDLRSAVLRKLYGNYRYLMDGRPVVGDPGEFAEKLGIAGDWWSVQQQLINALWVYRSSVRDDIENRREVLGIGSEPYIGVHIRRGDKHTEAPYTALESYVEILSEPIFRSMPVVLATDDARVGVQLQEMLGAGYDVLCLADSGEGHFQDSFNSQRRDVRWQETVRLLFELDMLAGARFFVGAAPSNVFYWIRYRRANQGIVDANDGARMQRVAELLGDEA